MSDPIQINPIPIDTFQKGAWRVHLVTAPGVLPVMTKAGSVDAAYRAGDALLAENENVICGPVGLVGALDLAERILEGELRARTNGHSILILAMALVAFCKDPAPVVSPEAVVPTHSGEAAEPAVVHATPLPEPIRSTEQYLADQAAGIQRVGRVVDTRTVIA